MQGADPLTPKAADTLSSKHEGPRVGYRSLQDFVDKPLISDAQNCGNTLTGAAPFAMERGLVRANEPDIDVTLFIENKEQTAAAPIQTPGGWVTDNGDAEIAGMPAKAAPVAVEPQNMAGSTCCPRFPSGHVSDKALDTRMMLLDICILCIVLDASDFGLSSGEDPADLEANDHLCAQLDAIRLVAGPLSDLGNEAEPSVSRLTIAGAPKSDEAVSTRSFFPYHCRKAIGVFGAISVALACLTPGAVDLDLATPTQSDAISIVVEHPTGTFTVLARRDDGTFRRTEVLRAARRPTDGTAFTRS